MREYPPKVAPETLRASYRVLGSMAAAGVANGVSPTTAWKWLRRLGIQPSRHDYMAQRAVCSSYLFEEQPCSRVQFAELVRDLRPVEVADVLGVSRPAVTQRMRRMGMRRIIG